MSGGAGSAAAGAQAKGGRDVQVQANINQIANVNAVDSSFQIDVRVSCRWLVRDEERERRRDLPNL